MSRAERRHLFEAEADALALAFIAFRAIHAACYIADKPMLRSHAWRFGILCVIGLFVVAAVYGKS